LNYVLEIAALIESITNAIEKPIARQDYEIVDRGIPHKPPSQMPVGKMAIYAFIYNGRFLKIGKANQKSKARFTYQHYNPKSAPSTLAKSIINDVEFADIELDESNIGAWIKQNCRRIDILVDDSLGVFALGFIESILHYRYEPKYEGFSSQR
jgi:hypothetical protein